MRVVNQILKLFGEVLQLLLKHILRVRAIPTRESTDSLIIVWECGKTAR